VGRKKRFIMQDPLTGEETSMAELNQLEVTRVKR
jgi:hypothetical protein